MEVRFLICSCLLYSLSTTLAQYDNLYDDIYDEPMDYEQYFDDDMDTTAREEYWPKIDDEIQAREEEYYRRRRQILINRFSSAREKLSKEKDKSICPVKCTCSMPDEVHCTFRFLTNIPEDLPSTMEKLNMGYNKLSTLPSRVFDKYSANLRILFLHSNDIRSISNSVFSKLSKVEVLRLSWNKITGIRKIALHGLHNLERLYLDNNRLSFIHPLALRGLTNLKLLQLDGNRLSRLHQDIFVTIEFQKYFKFSSIQYLYLSQNMFENLPRHIFDPMERLRHVYLQDNRWECSCQLRWLKQWIQDEDKYSCKKNAWNPSKPEKCAVCSSPARLADVRLQNVSYADFTCESPTFGNRTQEEVIHRNYPDVTDPDVIAAHDDATLFHFSDFYSTSMNIRLDCRKRSVFHARCNLTRIPKARVQGELKESQQSSGGTISHRYIGLFEAEMHCSAEYPRNVTLLRDILNPYLDQTLNLTFVKALKGQMKKHQSEYVISTVKPNTLSTTSTPITGAGISSSSSIMRSHTSQITLHSKDFNPELQTISLVFNTTVSYTHTPVLGQYAKKPWELIKHPRNSVIKVLLALEKKTTTIRCKAVGQPKPNIRWVLPNNILLQSGESSGRYSVSRSGRLFIRRSTAEDAGIYRCIATVRETSKDRLDSKIEDAALSTIRVVVLERTKDTNLRAQDYPAQEGSSWNATCTVNGFPHTTMLWITPSHHMIQRTRTDRSKRFSVDANGTLHVERFEKSDEGTYRCVAANLAGYAERAVTAKFSQNLPQTENPVDPITLKVDTTSSQYISPTSIINTKIQTKASLPTTKITTETQFTPTSIPLTSIKIFDEPKREPTVIPVVSTPPPIPSKPNIIDPVGVGPPDMNRISIPVEPVKPSVSEAFGNNGNRTNDNNGEAVEVESVTESAISGTAPRIIQPVVTEMEMPYNSKLNITCNATGHPKPNISWSLVPASSAMEGRILTIEKVTKNLTFECRASNELGNDSVAVNVFVKSMKPQLNKGLAASVSALDGLSVHLDCSADGFPVPRYIWHFPNNSLVNSTQEFFLLTNGTLIIEKVDPTLSGIYRCTTENTAGKAELAVNLIVTVPPKREISLEITATSPKYNGFFTTTPKNFTRKPVFVQSVQRETIEKEKITLPPLVDVEIHTISAQTTKTINSTKSVRVLENVTTAEPYTTTRSRHRTKSKLPRLPKNRNDIVRSDYIITPAISIFKKHSTRRGMFNYPPTSGSYKYEHPRGYRTKNKIYDYSYAVQGLHDHHILLPCNARIPVGHHSSRRSFHQLIPHSQSYTWTLPSGLVYQRSSLSPDWRYFLFGNGSLMIRGLTMKDIGLYRCNVKFKRDNVEIRTRVILHIQTKKPHIHEYSYDYTEVKPGETFTIPCTATGSPTPKVTWSTPTGSVIEMGKWHNRMNIFSNGTLVISNIHPMEVGRYICTASNTVGMAKRIVQVRIASYPPKFLHPKNIVNYVRRGGTIKLTCSASGLPSPSYSWMLPNKDVMESNQAVFQGRITPPKIAMLSGGTLIINRADSSDEGRYYCTAKNQLGRDVALVVLRVYK